MNAHWGRIAAADFFTTEVWTWQGLVTYYTVFVIDLASRRVQILGSTPHPEALFMQQIVRTLTMAEAGVVSRRQVLICDRDRKWSHDVRRRLRDAGIRVVLIPERAPNANAYAERFVRSIKEECLDRIVPIGERHFRHAMTEFVEHYHRERNHQGLDNRLIAGTPVTDGTGRLRCRRRLGGLLNFYERVLSHSRIERGSEIPACSRFSSVRGRPAESPAGRRERRRPRRLAFRGRAAEAEVL